MSALEQFKDAVQNLTFLNKQELWMSNMGKNMSAIIGGRDIGDLHKLKDEPCLVVGAGPSINQFKQLDVLSESHWNHPLIAADRMLLPLLKRKIVPDIVISVDGDHVIRNFYTDPLVRDYMKEVKAVFNAQTVHPDVVKTWKGETYWFIGMWDNPLNPLSLTRTFHLMTGKKTMFESYGNCLDEDTKVFLNSTGQPTKISDVKIGSRILCLNGGKVDFGLITNVVNQGLKDIFILRTFTRKIKATSEHLFAVPIKKKIKVKIEALRNKPRKKCYALNVWRNQWEITWRPLSEIKEGDYIVVLKQMPETKNEFLPDGTKASISLMRVLGALLGDGYIRIRQPPYDGGEVHLFFYEKQAQEYRKLINEAFELFEIECKINKGLTIYSKKLASWLCSLGFNKPSEERDIPDWVFGMNPDLKEAFIKGYLDADGYNQEDSSLWMFESASQKLIEGLKWLAVSIGMRVTNISTRKRNVKINNGYKEYSYNNVVTWSLGIAKGGKKASKKYAYSSLLRGLSTQLPKFLAVEKVRQKVYVEKKRVYDLAINEAHNFFADGILVHNCGSGSWALAHYLGCNPIGMMGIDYSYYTNRLEDTIYYETFKLLSGGDMEQLRSNYKIVQTWSGTNVLTDAIFLVYYQMFMPALEAAANTTTFNLSPLSILSSEKVKGLALEEFIKKYK